MVVLGRREKASIFTSNNKDPRSGPIIEGLEEETKLCWTASLEFDDPLSGKKKREKYHMMK